MLFVSSFGLFSLDASFFSCFISLLVSHSVTFVPPLESTALHDEHGAVFLVGFSSLKYRLIVDIMPHLHLQICTAELLVLAFRATKKNRGSVYKNEMVSDVVR